jgi:hypothetical protein
MMTPAASRVEDDMGCWFDVGLKYHTIGCEQRSGKHRMVEGKMIYSTCGSELDRHGRCEMNPSHTENDVCVSYFDVRVECSRGDLYWTIDQVTDRDGYEFTLSDEQRQYLEDRASWLEEGGYFERFWDGDYDD